MSELEPGPRIQVDKGHLRFSKTHQTMTAPIQDPPCSASFRLDMREAGHSRIGFGAESRKIAPDLKELQRATLIANVSQRKGMALDARLWSSTPPPPPHSGTHLSEASESTAKLAEAPYCHARFSLMPSCSAEGAGGAWQSFANSSNLEHHAYASPLARRASF